MRNLLRNRAGFTLVELIIASLLFALIAAGLAAIYASVFRQAGRVLAENHIKNQAAVAMRAIQRELSQATSISSPAPGVNADSISGCRNLRADGGLISPSARAYGTFDAGCFHFCVKTTAGGQCTTLETHKPPCLYYYKPAAGTSWDYSGGTAPPGPLVGTCGSAVGGVTPEILAWNLTKPSDVPNYFNRTAAYKANEITGIRIKFAVNADKAPTHPKLTYEADSTIDLTVGNYQ